MEQEQKTLIEFQGKPYFMFEKREGVFAVVRRFFIKDNTLYHEEDGDMGELERGLDIIEIANRSVKITVRQKNNEFLLISAAPELRKLASLTDCEYVSYEPVANSAGKFLCQEGNLCVYEIQPRLFRKYRNN